MRHALVTAAVCATVAATAPAHADDLAWDPRWPRFQTGEVIATLVAAAGVTTLYVLPPRESTWGGGILFDDAARSAFRPSTDKGREVGALVSNIGYFAMLLEPMVVSGPIVPWLRGSRDVGTQITLMNLEALAFTGLLFRISEATVARARPYVWDCKKANADDPKCREHGPRGTNSFMSGHAGVAATGAALICSHQMRLHLYGRVGGPIACGTAISLAFLAGFGRIVADRHYATDVVAGWIVGTLSGILVPALLHYGFDGRGVGESRDTAATAAPVTVSFGSTF